MALTKTDSVSEADFRRLSLDDPQGRWELYRGQLRERPAMSVSHGRVMDRLLAQLYSRLNLAEFGLRTQHAWLRISPRTYYIPDIAVIPLEMERVLLELPRSLDAYPEPLPLVVEIWSPSTGNYDDNEKIRDYQTRGDLEIWRIHPYDRTLTAWRRQPDGAYVETVYRDGVVHLSALPAVAIDVTALFAP